MARRIGSKQAATEQRTAKIAPDVLRVIQQVAEEAAEKAAKRASYRAVREVVKEVAQIAVYETLTSLGFKSDTPEAREEVIVDARFMRKLRVAAETNPAKYGFALFTTLCTVAGALIIFGIQQFLAPFFNR